ncbi:MAG TPA: DUF3300 domain-containing protein [Reyranella sp.]|nr:DUF3300 domain-containing protein [Reyranella sp.]
MKRRSFLSLSVVVLALSSVRAVRAQDAKTFKPEELDQMLAPIALYPDPLLSQILMAAGYPLEIVEAARWQQANPALKGDAAVQAVKDKDWDTSVKSLVAFPDVLKQLNEHLDWTQKLGDAMIEQQADVADSIQRLRAKAAAAGNLQSTPQQAVTTEGSGDNIQYIIQPANPEVVYVPQYNPSWAYGPWPYPAYPPVYYPFGGALATGIFWGLGIAAGAALIGGWAWGGRGQSYANINVNRAANIDNNFNRNQINRPDRPDRPDRPGAGGGGERWQHRPEHRKGVAYRDNATRQRFNQAPRPGAAQRDQFRGRIQNPAGASPGNRPGAGQGIANRPGGAQGIGNRPGGGQGLGNRGGGGQINRAQPRPNALGGVNRGQQINRQSTRGNQQMNRAQSRGGGGGRPGGGGGGRPGGGGGGRPGGGGARGGGGRR